MQSESWRREPPPEVHGVNLEAAVELFPTGWTAALRRPVAVDASPVNLQMAAPKVVSVNLTRQKVKIKVSGFTFPESPMWNWKKQQDGDASQQKPTAKPTKPTGSKPARQTRIKPPGEIVKLEDRLYYVLQPPLENLASSESLTFPFEPFPYQFEGIAFMFPRYAAVLADEMGLGKTMQAISTIRFLLCSGELKSVLLICPKPLVTNWQREFALWAPEVPITTIEGDSNRRRWQWQQENAPVKIANYELLMRDRDVLTGGLNDDGEPADPLHFDLVVLDEAQRIKNRLSTTSKVVQSISRTRNWALTGTPVENSHEDLVGIFEFLAPGFINGHMRPAEIGKAVNDYILRRTKDKVLTDMPPRLYRDASLTLTPEQTERYRAAEDDGVIKLNEMGDAITVQHVFELVLRLKQICNFDPVTGASAKVERLQADMEEVAASGQKAIVFSQWVKSIEQISEKLGRFHPLQYHGKIPSKQRDGILQRFKEDPKHSVLLMSYGAGSVGLNLQFCRYVFLFDRWWNPAVEDQAINRAHRIGAAGSVTVSRMLIENSIEQRINNVLEEKRELFNTIFQETGNTRRGGLTQKEIFGLFNLRTPQGPMQPKEAA